MKIILQPGFCYLFILIFRKIYAKFRKNPSSGFQDEFVIGERTEKGVIIEPVALTGSNTDMEMEKITHSLSVKCHFWPGIVFLRQNILKYHIKLFANF